MNVNLFWFIIKKDDSIDNLAEQEDEKKKKKKKEKRKRGPGLSGGKNEL